MSTILTSEQGRVIRAAFRAGPAAPDELLGLLVRAESGLKNRSQMRLAGRATAPYPERGATTVVYSRMGGFSYSVTGRDWRAGLELSENDLVGDTLGKLKAAGAEMAANYALQYRAHLLTILTEGDTDTYGTAFDGQYFFDTDHTYTGDLEYKTAMRNLITASEVSGLNVTTTTNPTVAEWHALAYPLLDYIVRGTKSDRGKALFTGAETWHLLVPMAMGLNARKAFEADLTGGGDSNVVRGMWRVHPVAELTAADTNVFYLFVEKPGGAEKPFIHAWWNMANGRRYDFNATDESDDLWVSDRKLHYSVSSHEDIVYGDWRFVYRCVLS